MRKEREGELPDGIHRVVSADIDEIADLMLLEDADELLELRRVLCRILQLEAAGAECGGRGHGQGGEHVLDMFDAAQIQADVGPPDCATKSFFPIASPSKRCIPADDAQAWHTIYDDSDGPRYAVPTMDFQRYA